MRGAIAVLTLQVHTVVVLDMVYCLYLVPQTHPVSVYNFDVRNRLMDRTVYLSKIPFTFGIYSFHILSLCLSGCMDVRLA
jgi:hypothetical protein